MLARALILLLSLTLFVVSLLSGGKMHLSTEMSFKATSQAILKLNKYLSPKPLQKASSAAESERYFIDGYDAEIIANYYGVKYRRSKDYLLTIVRNTAAAAKENNVSPFILLAIISHESNFLHTARNNSGAEGLMQVMSKVHRKRFDRYGGIRMTYVPEVNIRVGASILRDCMGIMKSVRGSLRCYAGTINSDDGGFVDFVLNEAAMIKKISSLPTAESTR